jgi:hypothetical protein
LVLPDGVAANARIPKADIEHRAIGAASGAANYVRIRRDHVDPSGIRSETPKQRWRRSASATAGLQKDILGDTAHVN